MTALSGKEGGAPVNSPASRSTGLHPRRGRSWGQVAGYIFIAPAIIYLAVFMLIPFVRGIELSFTDAVLVNPSGGSFVGADNYVNLVTSDRFWNSLAATFIYTATTVVLSMIIGTAAAVLINRRFRGRAIVRAVLTFPYAMPTVAVTLIFIWIYNPSGGVLNRATGALGFGQVGWLTDPSYGMVAVVATTVWKVFPFVMLVMLAALQSVPEELFEATRVDGADSLSTFRAIVLPHLMPTIRIVALLMTIWSIRRFEIIFLLTGGGPVEKTNTLVINIYKRAFGEQQLGAAAAIAGLGLLLSVAVTVVFFLAERREGRKEGAS